MRGKAFADATVGLTYSMADVLFLMLTDLSFNLGLWLYLRFDVASCVLSFL